MALADVPEESRKELENFVFQRLLAAEKKQRAPKKVLSSKE